MAYLLVPKLFGRLNEGCDQCFTYALTLGRVSDPESLHLADIIDQGPNGDAAKGLIAYASGKEELSAGRCVLARHASHLGIEILEAQIEIEPFGVFVEELDDIFKVFLGAHSYDAEVAWLFHRYFCFLANRRLTG